MAYNIITSFIFSIFIIQLDIGPLVATTHTLNRIVGGVAVSNDEYIAYQISLQVKEEDGTFDHHCGGSILSSEHILTAAHCVADLNPKELMVVAGIRDLNDTRGQRSRVISYEIHEDYKRLKTADIALLDIYPPLKLDGISVDKIKLNGFTWIDGDVTCLLTGWGASNSRGDSYPNRMQKLIYKTISNEECQAFLKQVTDAELCAREAIFSRGSCLADSGGPLVVRRGQHLRQVGIVSYGTSTCAINYPDVYTRISTFYDWIMDRIL